MAECAPVTSDPCCALLHISPLGPNWSWCSTYSLQAPKHATAFIPKLPFSPSLSSGTVFWVSSLILLLTSVWSVEVDTRCSLSYCACSPMHLHYNGPERNVDFYFKAVKLIKGPNNQCKGFRWTVTTVKWKKAYMCIVLNIRIHDAEVMYWPKFRLGFISQGQCKYFSL